MAIRFFDMFAGIGGFRSGLEAIGGFECIGHCEIDKYANQAYNAIYDMRGELYFEDARTINPNDLPEIDLICAGFPCQSFSVAGKRLGFKDDTRGTLFFEVARIAEAKRPAYLLLENVPGLLSHDGGRTLTTIFSALTELGYDLEWCVHNSAHFGVPQQRRRLYIVASLGGRCTGRIFPLACGNAENLKELIPGPQGQRVYETDGVACTQCAGSGGWGGKTGLYFIDMNSDPIITGTARCITARQDSGVSNYRGEHSAVLVTDEPRAILTPDREKVRQQGRRIKEPNEPMFTITAQDRHGVWHKGRIRKLMPIECWRLQGFTDNLNSIKSKTVGDGQHGTARWATKSEIRKTYRRIPFTPNKWRKQAENGRTPTVSHIAKHRFFKSKKKEQPEEALPQGIVVGCTGGKHNTTALVDTGDVHVLMIGAAGVGKTAYWLYPCIEYACASGMSFLSTDTKGDVMRNYGNIAKQYGYNVSVIDLRNPTRSNGNNLLHLVNKYMDLYQSSEELVYKAKAEKYAKIISKTIILSGMDAENFGQNAYSYDAAEGLLMATILLVTEFCKPEKRHIVSVFKIIQELLAPSQKKGKNQFQQLMEMLPNNHKAKWFAGAALNTAEQSMASVMSTALSRLNSFLDSELEQLLCFDTEIDAEKFCNEKSAIFVIMPEENPNTFFMISLIIQQLYREILSVADENGGKLKNRCVFFCDEFGTLPKIESAEMMFSASRSRRLQIVPIIQSFSQLDKNYGKEGAEIIVDNTQITLFGGFAPNSSSAEDSQKH